MNKEFLAIGNEIDGYLPEVEVFDEANAENANTVLAGGAWATTNGEWCIEFEANIKTAEITYIQVSLSENENACYEIKDFSQFAELYPNCMQELKTFVLELNK